MERAAFFDAGVISGKAAFRLDGRLLDWTKEGGVWT